MSKKQDEKTRKEKRADEISRLERGIKKIIEEKGLAAKVRFGRGKLLDDEPDNRPYIEFKREDKDIEEVYDPNNPFEGCEPLEGLLLRVLKKRNIGFAGVESERPYPQTRLYRVRLVIDPSTDLGNEGQYLKRVLSNIRDALSVYSEKHKAEAKKD